MESNVLIQNKPLLDAFRSKCDGHVFKGDVTLFCLRNHESKEESKRFRFNLFPFMSVFHRHQYIRLEHLDQCSPYYSIYAIQSIFSTN